MTDDYLDDPDDAQGELWDRSGPQQDPKQWQREAFLKHWRGIDVIRDTEGRL